MEAAAAGGGNSVTFVVGVHGAHRDSQVDPLLSTKIQVLMQWL